MRPLSEYVDTNKRIWDRQKQNDKKKEEKKKKERKKRERKKERKKERWRRKKEKVGKRIMAIKNEGNKESK